MTTRDKFRLACKNIKVMQKAFEEIDKKNIRITDELTIVSNIKTGMWDLGYDVSNPDDDFIALRNRDGVITKYHFKEYTDSWLVMDVIHDVAFPY